MIKDIISVGKKDPVLSEEEELKRQKMLTETFHEAFNEEDEEDDDL